MFSYDFYREPISVINLKNLFKNKFKQFHSTFKTLDEFS